jgi:hypothetical protein
LGCWISPFYGLFSLGARFETYEQFISLILKFFSGHGELQTLISEDGGTPVIHLKLQVTEEKTMSVSSSSLGD